MNRNNNNNNNNRRRRRFNNGGFQGKRRAMPAARHDLAVMRRQFQNNYTLSLNNLLTSSDSNIANTFLSWKPTGIPGHYRSQFRRLRLARIEVYAQTTQSALGAMQTVADADTTHVTFVINNTSSTTLSSTAIRYYPGARTISLTKGLKRMASFRPQLRTMASPSVVYSKNQWVATNDLSATWRGINIMVENVGGGKVYIDPAKQQKVYLLVREHWEFQGRILDPSDNPDSLPYGELTPESDSATQIEEDTPYALTLTPAELKNGFLTGAFHPYVDQGVNFGNIGGSVTPEQLIGIEFRINSNPDIRYVVADSDVNFVYCNFV